MPGLTLQAAAGRERSCRIRTYAGSIGTRRRGLRKAAFLLEDLIEGSGPIELDIGFGRGLSLFERAAAAPESRLIGIEVKTKLAYKVNERLQKHELLNVAILCGDAREILKRAEPARSVQRAALHFPDPWWKKRHDKRRVIGEALLAELHRLMKPGGELFIQTDVEHRAEQYLAQLRETAGFTLASHSGYVESEPVRCALQSREARHRRRLAGLAHPRDARPISVGRRCCTHALRAPAALLGVPRASRLARGPG